MTRMQWAIISILGVAVIGVFCILISLAFVMLSQPRQVVVIEVTPTPNQSVLVLPSPTSRLMPSETPTWAQPTIPPRQVVPTVATKIEPEVIVKEQQCKVVKEDIFCMVTVTASSKNPSPVNPYFYFDTFDPNGISLGEIWEATNSLFPGETRKVFVRSGLKSGTKWGRYDFRFDISTIGVSGNNFTSSPLSASNIEYKPGSFIYDKVIAIITNSSDKKIDKAEVTVILYDSKGAFVGGGTEFVPMLPPKGKARVEANVEKFGTVSKVEVYPTFTSISTIE